MLYEVRLENPELPILGEDGKPEKDEDGKPTGRVHYRRMVCDVPNADAARALAYTREACEADGSPSGYEIVSVTPIEG